MNEKAMKKSQNRLKEALAGLRRELGNQHVQREENGRLKVWFVGCETPVTIWPSSHGRRPLYRVRACIAPELDWDMPGLADYLMRENASIYWGRFENYGGALVIEQNLFAMSTTVKQLATVVACLASTVMHERHDLTRMGALTVPIAEGPPLQQ